MRMNCRCGARPIWVEMAPDVGPHRYSVQCSKCGKQAKWGGVEEFERLVEEGGDDLVLTYAEQAAPKPDPFAAFVSDN